MCLHAVCRPLTGADGAGANTETHHGAAADRTDSGIDDCGQQSFHFHQGHLTPDQRSDVFVTVPFTTSCRSDHDHSLACWFPSPPLVGGRSVEASRAVIPLVDVAAT